MSGSWFTFILSEGLYLIFPQFQTKALLGINDIYVDATPGVTNHYQSEKSCIGNIATMSICRNMSHFQGEVQIESAKVDNLLANLHRYYKDIKMT